MKSVVEEFKIILKLWVNLGTSQDLSTWNTAELRAGQKASVFLLQSIHAMQ